MNLPPDARFTLNVDSVAWSELGEDAVLVQLESDHIHVANPTGRLLLNALKEASSAAKSSQNSKNGLSLNELVVLVTEHYEVTADIAQNDVEAFVQALLSASLISQST